MPHADIVFVVWLAAKCRLLSMLECLVLPEGLNYAFTFSLFKPPLPANETLSSLKELSRLSSRTIDTSFLQPRQSFARLYFTCGAPR
jgi:hypothetical protein